MSAEWSAPETVVLAPGIVATADLSARFLAWSVDGMLSGAGMLVGGGAAAVGCLLVQGEGGPDVTATAPFVMGVALTALFAVTVVQWTLLVRDGQSLGKRWMGIRIVDKSGDTPGFFQVLVVRTWAVGLVRGFFGACGFVLLLCDGAMILLPNRRCFHDYLAGTWVIADGP